MNELEKALLSGNPGGPVRTWGVIDETKGTYVIKGTCRGCGDHGEFTTQQQAQEFRKHHQGTNNKCPHAGDVVY